MLQCSNKSGFKTTGRQVVGMVELTYRKGEKRNPRPHKVQGLESTGLAWVRRMEGSREEISISKENAIFDLKC